MSGESKNAIIDLTEPSIVDVIELDDSVEVEVISPNSPSNSRTKARPRPQSRPAKKKISEKSKPIKKKSQKKQIKKSEASKGIGNCPICMEKLGKNALACTKCGHVFCLQCIQQAVKRTKQCPFCRCVLRGPSAYHPLYLSLH